MWTKTKKPEITKRTGSSEPILGRQEERFFTTLTEQLESDEKSICFSLNNFTRHGTSSSVTVVVTG